MSKDTTKTGPGERYECHALTFPQWWEQYEHTALAGQIHHGLTETICRNAWHSADVNVSVKDWHLVHGTPRPHPAQHLAWKAERRAAVAAWYYSLTYVGQPTAKLGTMDGHPTE